MADVRAHRRQDPIRHPDTRSGFSVAPEVTPVPRSLANIYTEYSDDLGYPRPVNGDPHAMGRRGRAAAQPRPHRRRQ